jgi:hypothetical protein
VGPMRPVSVVELFPRGTLAGQVDVVGEGQQLIELLLVRPVRAFHLAVQLRRSRRDIDVSDALILDVPMELRLPRVPTVWSDGVDAVAGSLPEWKGAPPGGRTASP